MSKFQTAVSFNRPQTYLFVLTLLPASILFKGNNGFNRPQTYLFVLTVHPIALMVHPVASFQSSSDVSLRTH